MPDVPLCPDPAVPARFQHKPGLVATDLESELILLDPSTQEMYGLNATGRAVWYELPHHDLTVIAGRLAAAFEADATRALADVEGIVGALIEAGLVKEKGEVPAVGRQRRV